MCETIAKTKSAYLWTSFLTTPFWVVFNMLPFILYKDLQASTFQIALLVTLKPMVSLFSGYWSAHVKKRRDRLLSNVIYGRVISHLPFLCFPFIHNTWFYIAAFALYMALHRGVIPAWMEILKINIPVNGREKVVAWGSFLGYAGGAVLSFILGGILDKYALAWQWIFPATALISLSAIFFKQRIPIATLSEEPFIIESSSWREAFASPWNEAWNILKSRPDFFRYQLGFMLGGGGIMIIQPVLPAYFVDTLKLSYTEMAIAITVCKGIGFAVTSPLWSMNMNKMNIFRLSSFPPLCICCFTACLAVAPFSVYWVYLAFLFYGIMQAGSEMTWHLSGLAFAGKEDSSGYSSVNVLAVGARGCVIPPLGSLLSLLTSPLAAIIMGGSICLMAHRYLYTLSYKPQCELE